jgi:hypothetical protein
LDHSCNSVPPNITSNKNDQSISSVHTPEPNSLFV